jgi:hypothetical protein
MGRMTVPVRIGPGAEVGVTEEMIRPSSTPSTAACGAIPSSARSSNAASATVGRAPGEALRLLVVSAADDRPLPGSPMAAHGRVAAIRDAHFARWLELFGQTRPSIWPPDAAGWSSRRRR